MGDTRASARQGGTAGTGTPPAPAPLTGAVAGPGASGSAGAGEGPVASGSAGAGSGADPATELKFEDALGRLETLVEEMESGDLALEETIARFEEGQKLLRVCGHLLDRAEQRVKSILKRADGALETEVWDEEEAAGDEGA